jgi:mannose-6-phosphate isomerase
MDLIFSSTSTKAEVMPLVNQFIDNQRLTSISRDWQRPWGGFFVIDEQQSAQFIDIFFPHLDKAEILTGKKVSPKILVVEPGKRLSWQYHHRRSEIWKVIGGTAGVVTSLTDEENDVQRLPLNTIITLKQGERHRLIGLDNWGVIAEIWQHTDVNEPSNEDDIVRVQDDFGR